MLVAHLDLGRIQVVEFAVWSSEGPEDSHSCLWDSGGSGIANLQIHNTVNHARTIIVIHQ